ncbi:MAG: DUF2703 domain-containing protein [Candidatus Micrarchaeota archaeon]
MNRKLHIEFRYFDRSTCSRCRTTDKNAEKVIRDLRGVLRESGVDVQLKVTKLPASRLAESNSILINGKDIVALIYGKMKEQESPCRGCGTLLDSPCNCRTYNYRGKRYRYVPKAMIREAISKALGKTSI